MAVLLRHSRDLPSEGSWDEWVAIGAPAPGTGVAKADLGKALEDAFARAAEHWLALGRHLSETGSAALAHAPACAANVSDLGLMMAWTLLVEDWAAAAGRVLVVCDDPWLFRHLAALDGIVAGKPPPLLTARLRAWARGVGARWRFALRAALWSLRLPAVPANRPGGAVLMVYGHPRSTSDGIDGYFGELMRRLPDVTRVLHVDCPPGRAKAMAADGRTVSLHGFGHPLFSLSLLGAKWRPTDLQCTGRWGRLVHRAACREGATAQGAAILWQAHCQARWLRQARPGTVAWPWENHSWERLLAPLCRSSGIATLGYQHSVIGRWMLNYRSSAGGDALPDRILCNGAAPQARLAGFGLPSDRLLLAGALRFTAPAAVRHDPAGPVFVALPFDLTVAAQMVEACKAVEGMDFVVKDHPMTPFRFAPTDRVRPTDQPLGAQTGIRATLYAATTVGQEALLAGIPTFRFLPADRVAIDVMPEGMEARPVTAASLAAALATAVPPQGLVAADTLFAPVDWTLWQQLLGNRP